MGSPKPYYRLMRIKSWLGFFLLAFFGILLSREFLFSSESIGLYLIIVVCFLGFSFSINDCFDVEADLLSKKKNPLTRKEIRLRNAIIFSSFLGIGGAVLSTYFSLNAFLFCALLTTLSFIYSAPPLRLKSRFLWDVISHGLFFGALLFFLPFVVFNLKISLFHYALAFSIFWFSVITELRNHVRDYEGDKKAGLKTTACVLGKSKSESILFFLEVLYPISLFPVFIFCEDVLLSVMFSLCYPLYLLRSELLRRVRSNRYFLFTSELFRRVSGFIVGIKHLF